MTLKFFLLIGIIGVCIKIINLIYLFQIKEYRLDRIKAAIGDLGVGQIFFKITLQTPAFTIRNIIIAALSVTTLFLIFIKTDNTLKLLMIFFYPITAFILVTPFIWLTGLFSLIKKFLIIYQAKKIISQSNAVFIGITGSYGKTTTKDFLHTLLSEKYKVEKTKDNFNTEIGIAQSIISSLKSDTQFFIVEMGAYKRGEIKAICDFIKPKYAIITAIGNQHLALFGSKNNLISAKKELIQSLPADGIAFVNQDFPEFSRLIEGIDPQKITPYSINENYPYDQFVSYNKSNLLPCIKLAKLLKLSDEEISNSVIKLKKFEKPHLFQGLKKLSIIDNSYSLNVEGFIRLIKYISQQQYKNKLIITKGIIELGSDKPNSYAKILSQIKGLDLQILTTDKLLKKLDTTNQVKFFLKDADIFDNLINLANAETLVGIAGRFSQKYINQLL